MYNEDEYNNKHSIHEIKQYIIFMLYVILNFDNQIISIRNKLHL